MGEALSGFSSSEPWGALEGPQADVSAASCATLDVIPSTEARVAGESPGLAQPAQANPSAGRTQRREGKAGEAVPADNKSEEGMEAEECRGLEGGLQGGAEADAEAEAGNTSAQKTPWDCYVIVHSVSKKHNIGMLLRSATAFGVRQMVVVGRRDISTFGHHGTADYVDLKHFYHMKDARSYLKVNSLKQPLPRRQAFELCVPCRLHVHAACAPASVRAGALHLHRCIRSHVQALLMIAFASIQQQHRQGMERVHEPLLFASCSRPGRQLLPLCSC